MRGVMAAFCGAMIAGGMPAYSQTVTVAFVQPENYTDASPYGGFGIQSEQPALDEIGRYVQSLGDKYLPRHQTLVIDVLDIDLAGQFEPWQTAVDDIRVLRAVYTPKIRMYYKLTEGRRTLAEGEETVVDTNYLNNPSVRLVRGPLSHEKAMLFDWFQRCIVGP